MAATGGGILRGARHGHLLHPSCASRPGRLAVNVTDSPWTRHQQRAQKLNGTSARPVDAIYRDAHHGERHSRRDWYKMPYRTPRGCEPHVAQYEAPRHLKGPYVTTRANPIAQLAKMQDFQGEGNDRLDSFFYHVEELVDFDRWDKREMCRQARAPSSRHGTCIC